MLCWSRSRSALYKNETEVGTSTDEKLFGRFSTLNRIPLEVFIEEEKHVGDRVNEVTFVKSSIAQEKFPEVSTNKECTVGFGVSFDKKKTLAGTSTNKKAIVRVSTLEKMPTEVFKETETLHSAPNSEKKFVEFFIDEEIIVREVNEHEYTTQKIRQKFINVLIFFA